MRLPCREAMRLALRPLPRPSSFVSVENPLTTARRTDGPKPARWLIALGLCYTVRTGEYSGYPVSEDGGPPGACRGAGKGDTGRLTGDP
jgi:hypothetical protein